MKDRTCWTEAKKKITNLPESSPFKDVLISLYELIKFVYESIPEGEKTK